MKSYWPKLLENGLMLALVTGLTYYLTYLRLDGSLAAYALPDELVEIDAPDIIATVIDLVYKFWRVLLIPAFGLMLGKLLKDDELTRLWRFSIVMVAAVVFAVSLVGRFEGANWILLGIMIYEWVEALAKTLLYGKAEKGLAAKWAAYRKRDEAGREINRRVASGIGYVAVGIAVMYVLSGAVMEHAAQGQMNRQAYFVANDHDDQLVVFENGTRYVLMAREGSKLLPAYEVVRYDHIGKLTYEHTGVLTLPDVVLAASDN
jgi:hypothetical protein